MLNLFRLLILTALFTGSVQAVILDDADKEPPKPAAKPKPREKSSAEQEVERLKRELAAVKRKQAQGNDAPEVSASSNSSGPNIEMVSLPSGILMGKYEVTQGQWRAVMGSNPSNFNSCGDNCPVENVSWDDVQQFIQRLNSQTGKRYRLPTEDEWYSACQAGSYNSEYCGSSSIDAVAWYGSNSDGTPHTVGQKQPNNYGLYDMSGNVWEWTNSCFENDCTQRVSRGGSWFNAPAGVRSASRLWFTSAFRFHSLGFRLAQDR